MSDTCTPNFDLRTLVETVFATAASIVSSNSEVVSAFVAKCADGTLRMYFTPWQNEEQKDQILRAMRVIFWARNVQAYVGISEVWAASVDKDDPDLDTPPSERAERREMLMVTGVERGHPPISATADLSRDPHHHEQRLCGPLMWHDFGRMQGRMVELLPPPSAPPPPSLSDAALDQLEAATFDILGLTPINGENLPQ